MKKENKETELISNIGKFIIKYLDYAFLFVVFPFIFDVRFADPKVFIALGSLIVIRAIMPGAKSLIDFDEEVSLEPDPKINPEVNIWEEIKKQRIIRFKPEIKSTFVPQDDIISQSIIDSTNQQLKMIRFGEGGQQIDTKKTDGDEVIVSFADFRTIRLKKDEVKRLYVALLESEYKFFQPGKWYLAVTAKKQ
jgi:hypothetical protein